TRPLGPQHPFQPYVGLAYRHIWIRPYPGTLLQATQPVGLAGGKSGQVLLGALWDTRNDEADPSRGGLEEVSLRLASPATLSDYSYLGVTASERRFFSVGRHVVL